jgi:protein-S-isoprenylcysteine O-methyltransferase Ste14
VRNRDPDSPGVVILPPVLYGGAFVLGLALQRLLPLGQLPRVPARLAGAACVVAGAALARWGEQVMRRAGTNIRPDQPTLALVTDGPFRFTRNPLYVCLTLLYMGVALMIPAVWPLLLLLPVLGVMRWGVISREERYLDRKFGEAYRTYAGKVRRWL